MARRRTTGTPCRTDLAVASGLVGELGWLTEGLCSVIEGLCSAVFAANPLTTVLSGGNLKYFRFRCWISTKKRKSAAENSVRFREIRWLEEGSKESATLHSINFGIVDAPTRSVWWCLKCALI
jgi:hypothetical protein